MLMKFLKILMMLMILVFIAGCPSKKDIDDDNYYSSIYADQKESERRCLEEKEGFYCTVAANFSMDRKKFKDEEKIVLVDKDEFLKWIKLGCEYKYSKSCIFLWAAFGPEAIDEIETNIDMSYKYAVKACDLYNESVESKYIRSYDIDNKAAAIDMCLMLSTYFYALGSSKYENPRKAIDLASIACEHGFKGACSKLSLRYKDIGDIELYNAWSEFACIYAMETESCLALVRKHHNEGNKEETDFFLKRLDSTFVGSDFILNYYWAQIMWEVKKDGEDAFLRLDFVLKEGLFDLEQIENDEVFKDFLETDEYKKLVEKYKKR
jgi:hypothetical protein